MDGQDTVTTEIHLEEVKDVKDGKRVWEVKVVHDKGGSTKRIQISDPFKPEQYSRCFKYFVDDSFQCPPHKRSSEEKRRLEEVETEIAKYGNDLLRMLDLDNPTYRKKRRNILIVERNDESDDDETSLHNLVWELLEDLSYWSLTCPDHVSVTRIIHPQAQQPSTEDSDEERHTDSGHHGPIRILLVIGRKLEHEQLGKNWVYKENVSAGVIQRSIMQVIRHLEDLGHPRKIQLDILRPATFNELKTYIGMDTSDCEAPKERFDIIHLDMHGEMRRSPETLGPKRPHLMFTSIPEGPPPNVSATELAETLRKRSRVLVMNACNSSSLKGELGIRMVRAFVTDNMTYVSATSYRLQETAAEIFYPRFYMSLMLNWSQELSASFSKAAADARLALRKNPKRHKGEKRDDFFVHWNWSNGTNMVRGKAPSRSFQLHRRVLLELVSLVVGWLFCILFKKHAWYSSSQDQYPMFTIHRNYDHLETHVRYAQYLDIPSITLYTLEIEYHLKGNEQHSVYLHPPNRNSERLLQSIKNLLRNMIRIWVETNFVTEVRVLQVKELLKYASHSWFEPRFWTNGRFESLILRPDWRWRRQNEYEGRRKLGIDRMLIVEGFEALEQLPNDNEQKENALVRIDAVLEEMKRGGECYVVTIGGLLDDDWRRLDSNYARKTIGRKWTEAEVMMLPVRNDVDLATYSRKIPINKPRDVEDE